MDFDFKLYDEAMDEAMDDDGFTNDTSSTDSSMLLDGTDFHLLEYNAVLALQALARDANSAYANAANLLHFHSNERKVCVMPLVKYCSRNSIPESASALFKRAASLHKRTQWKAQ